MRDWPGYLPEDGDEVWRVLSVPGYFQPLTELGEVLALQSVGGTSLAPDWSTLGSRFMMMIRQLSHDIKTQLKALKAPY